MRSGSPVKGTRQPFNFQQSFISRSPVGAGASVGGVNKPNQRRGHKYKHSSVSMNFFLEPPPRPAPVVPVHLPVPTTRETMDSMTRDQKIQLGWCSLHFLAAFQLWLVCRHWTVLVALSHIVFYDAVVAALRVVTDVLSNFDFWSTSSVRHPFGLRRAELLACCACAVGLLFMGIDIGSHLCENAVRHIIVRSSPLSVIEDTDIGPEGGLILTRGNTLALTLALAATIVSSTIFRAHDQTGITVRIPYLRNLPYGFSSPLYTVSLLSGAIVLVASTYASEVILPSIDALVALLIASTMCTVGWLSMLALGRMLLMGFDGHCAQSILKQIQDDPDIKQVEDSSMWQVHQGLCIINIKLRLHGPMVDETRVRANVNRIIADGSRAANGASEMNGFATAVNGSTTVNAVRFRGRTGIQWESTIDIDRS
ncbi:cation efflux family-domain-containing protein [Limtongia smithiae]|uniref:cation efflux family-domain-containing protein n=1 Tax=Limtongia smithiae TaxID=1125753 RepID=UPI0034D007D2